MTGFVSLSDSLTEWFNTPLSQLPQEAQNLVNQELHATYWNRWSPWQRREAARQWDDRNDPAKEAERKWLWDRNVDIYKLEQQIERWEVIPANSAMDLQTKESELLKLNDKLSLLQEEIKCGASPESNLKNSEAPAAPPHNVLEDGAKDLQNITATQANPLGSDHDKQRSVIAMTQEEPERQTQLSQREMADTEEEKSPSLPPKGSQEWFSINASHAANVRHSRPGGYRDKGNQVIAAWASGKYSTREKCAEAVCDDVGLSFSAARRWLRNTPDPQRCAAPPSSMH